MGKGKGKEIVMWLLITKSIEDLDSEKTECRARAREREGGSARESEGERGKKEIISFFRMFF